MLLNSDVCAHHPAIIEEGNKRKWEWLGHGVTNNIMGERLFKSRPYPAPEKYLDLSYLRRAQQELGITAGR